jgi:hypothetical protein
MREKQGSAFTSSVVNQANAFGFDAINGNHFGVLWHNMSLFLFEGRRRKEKSLVQQMKTMNTQLMQVSGNLKSGRRSIAAFICCQKI